MIMENQEGKNKISVGLIITKDQMRNNQIFPDEVKKDISDSPHYLLIFISREDVVKINCFPLHTNVIKKVLIKLTEFTPDIVNGISRVFKDLELQKKEIIHITGVCYEMEDCYYEAFISGKVFEREGITEAINERLTSLANILNVEIEDIPRL